MESAESSWLLLLLALTVTALMALVAFGSLRQLWVSEGALARFGGLAIVFPVALVGLVLGTGLSAAPVLALGAEGLNFVLGYGVRQALLLWLGACVVSAALAALPAWSRHSAVLCITGALLGLLAVALQCGWIWAAGLRPGVIWNGGLVATAALIEVTVFGAAIWLSLSLDTDGDERPTDWRLGAAMLLALGVAAAQEVLITGAGLQTQVGSVYARQIPGTVLCVVAGAAVPMFYGFVLLLRSLQQSAARRSGRRKTESLSGPRKRRRRHRVPML